MEELNPSRKKDGEKAFLLQACGEELFGAEGENKVTQGIYIVKKGRKLECFCKRAVWVPPQSALQTLKQRFAEFNAPFPPMLENTPVVGLCGRNATRTAHATDSCFLILALHSRMKFVAVGTVSIAFTPFVAGQKPIVHVTSISSDAEELDACIEWIRKEAAAYEKAKSHKRPKEKRDEIIAIDMSSKQPTKRQHRSTPFAEPNSLTQLKKQHVMNMEINQAMPMYYRHPFYPPHYYVYPPCSVPPNYPPPLVFDGQMMVPYPSVPPSSAQFDGPNTSPQMSTRPESESISSPEHIVTPLASAAASVHSPEQPVVFPLEHPLFENESFPLFEAQEYANPDVPPPSM